jgi:hypothetical protein
LARTWRTAARNAKLGVMFKKRTDEEKAERAQRKAEKKAGAEGPFPY